MFSAQSAQRGVKRSTSHFIPPITTRMFGSPGSQCAYNDPNLSLFKSFPPLSFNFLLKLNHQTFKFGHTHTPVTVIHQLLPISVLEFFPIRLKTWSFCFVTEATHTLTSPFAAHLETLTWKGSLSQHKRVQVGFLKAVKFSFFCPLLGLTSDPNFKTSRALWTS